jgi:ribose/xylose/arabinose/galactoside ABC-type transport system permease subunit
MPGAAERARSAGIGRIPSLFSNADLLINNILIGALVLMAAYFSFASRAFFSLANFEIILTNDAAIGVVVSFMTLLVIAGHVDLSVGSNIAFSGTLAALANAKWGYSDPASIGLGLAAAAGVGAVNGFLCGFLKFNPIIVTLGMLSVLRGAILLIEPTDVYGLGGLFNAIGNGQWLGVPVLLLIVIAAFTLSACFVSLTIWGRHIYALGINPQAAFLAALPVRGLPFALYVITGLAAGVAGVMLVSRLDGSSPGALGLQMELQALTIILLGGVAFAGGRGRILGVITAWIFLGVLTNGLTLLNVTPYVQLVAAGLALVLAAGLDTLGSVLVPRLQQQRRVEEQLRQASTRDATPVG